MSNSVSISDREHNSEPLTEDANKAIDIVCVARVMITGVFSEQMIATGFLVRVL